LKTVYVEINGSEVGFMVCVKEGCNNAVFCPWGKPNRSWLCEVHFDEQLTSVIRENDKRLIRNIRLKNLLKRRLASVKPKDDLQPRIDDFVQRVTARLVELEQETCTLQACVKTNSATYRRNFQRLAPRSICWKCGVRDVSEHLNHEFTCNECYAEYFKERIPALVALRDDAAGALRTELNVELSTVRYRLRKIQRRLAGEITLRYPQKSEPCDSCKSQPRLAGQILCVDCLKVALTQEVAGLRETIIVNADESPEVHGELAGQLKGLRNKWQSYFTDEFPYLCRICNLTPVLPNLKSRHCAECDQQYREARLARVAGTNTASHIQKVYRSRKSTLPKD